MEAVHIALALCVGVGMSAACGLRVFVPLLIVGGAARAGALDLAPDFAWAASTPALAGLGVATVIEIVAYYVPWLDHALDVIASPSAVLAGVLVTASLLGEVDPFFRWSLALVAGGGAAGTVQGATVLARAASGLSSAGLANPIVSTAEWVGAAATALVTLLAPPLALLALVIAIAILVRLLQRRRAARAIADGAR